MATRQIWGLIAVLVGIGFVAFWLFQPPTPSRSPGKARKAEPQSSSPATPGTPATYIGSAACASCHAEQHQSYLRTAHSQSFSLANPEREPPNVEFAHALSGRRYTVQRNGDQLLHGEYLTSAAVDGTPAVPAPSVGQQFSLRYLVGSGRHSRTYLIDDSGFLAESPITWFQARQSWSMSPGFDRPDPQGFEREADAGCLICHLGVMEPVQGSLARPKLVELAIGCERCHGPGSEHARFRRENPDRRGAADPIVMPARLARNEQESLCAECHLRGDASVLRPGRKLMDFRPGQPLHDYRVDYLLQSNAATMKVVGHVEQMRLSRCYQQSDTMTCTTCHAPHDAPEAATKQAFYRQRCLSCHQDSCQLPEAERTRQRPESPDNCVACHMPQTVTDIPHIAFTHHRIGKHLPEEPAIDSAVPSQLVVLDPPSDWTDAERERDLGLAYLELSDRTPRPAAEVYRSRAVTHLKKANNLGSDDGDFLAAMARLHWEQGSAEAVGFARESLRSASLSERSAANACLVLGAAEIKADNLPAAEEALRRLVGLRRVAEDWRLLGECQLRLGQIEDGLASLERAVAISPFRADLRSRLIDVCREVKQAARAEPHVAALAELLRPRTNP